MAVLETGAMPPSGAIGWHGTDVLVLSPTPTHPQDYGNRKRIFSVCTRLRAQGARITFVHYPAEAEWRRRVPAASVAAMARNWDGYYTVPVTRPLHTAPRAADHTIDEWWDEAIGDFLRWLFRVSSYDVFIVNYSWLSKAFEAAPNWIVKILDAHDRLAGRRAVLDQLLIAPEYFHTTDEEEAMALNRADLVWAIKDEERLDFERLTRQPVLSLSHLDPVRPLPVPVPDPDGYLRVGIIGAANSLNLANLRDFLAAAIPIFERFFAPIMIHVAGGVCALMGNADARFVRLAGRVEAVEDFYSGIDVAAIAMRASTGLKTKTGEALALGLPIVSLDHGFEGYVASHRFHQLTTFQEMAERLVDIAFDRELLHGLRAASLSSAQATEIGIVATIDKSRQIVAQLRRAVIFCVSAAAFDRRAPGHSAFASTLEYLGMLSNVVVLVVAGPLTPLFEGSLGLDGRLQVVVAAPLVDGGESAARLAAAGFGVAPVADVFARYGQKMVVVDALSAELLDVAADTGLVVLRAELLAQAGALAPRIDAIGAFLLKFARAVVMAPRPSPLLAALAAGAGGEFVTAPCCWRSAEIRRQIGTRRRWRQVLLMSDGRLRGLGPLLRFVHELALAPLLVRPAASEPILATADGMPSGADQLPAPEYLSGLVLGERELPEFAVDLSFGALGLQYLRELLLRLEVPTITADATVVHPSVVATDSIDRIHTYERLAARMQAAAAGDLSADASRRRRLELELEGDGGWAWLWRYGFDTLGFGDIGSV